MFIDAEASNTSVGSEEAFIAFRVQDAGTVQDVVTVDGNGLTVGYGDVILNADPTSNLHAATKQYVDNNGGADLSYTASTRVLASSSGTDVTLPEVVAAGNSGLMTGADKTKLDGIDTSSFLRSDANDTATGDLTLEGNVIIDSDSNSKSLYISRNGGTASEYTKIGRDDSTTLFHTNNDESSSIVRFRFENTDTESGGGAAANDRNIDFRSDATDARITIDGNRVLTTADEGAGNGLDADTLDGAQPNTFASASTIVQRTSEGYIYANYFNTTPNTVSDGSLITQVCVETNNDGWIRHGTADAIKEFLALDSALKSADIGVTVQGYDANTVKLNEYSAFTKAFKSNEILGNSSIDLRQSNNWRITSSVTVPTPTNGATGMTGVFRITAGTLVWPSIFKFPDEAAPTITSYPAIITYYVQDSNNSHG